MSSAAASRLAFWALIAGALSLSGCAIPPAITIASFVINAASYAATGKSVSDHGLSAVVGEDCALWRALADRKICTDNPGEPPRPAVAAANPPAPPKAATLVAAATDETFSQPAHESTIAPEARRFLVLGSFLNRENATHLAASLQGVETTIIPVDRDGATFHRVVAGPLDDRAFKALGERMLLVAGVRPWELVEPAGEVAQTGTPIAAAPTRTEPALLARRPASLPPG